MNGTMLLQIAWVMFLVKVVWTRVLHRFQLFADLSEQFADLPEQLADLPEQLADLSEQFEFWPIRGSEVQIK